ncbi:aminotransferase class V-fold PLP-dependent enzyme [Maritimibacter sp. UBA3975]|uniref:pyridoxal-phosphate-dependent aminotransferase family protein n=1 Tax=Maritimibacter sp. UBA3975 TaxID=1946833 RepID=UPI000C0AB7DF|nr:aminotransferase class V-fold PLP-dependent enzyme [Maritimibacter sp. UBA3975]MAM61444.1 aminotransferase [Maritimibacter sp.]|tara:strand:- start:8265 stop:9458 length:1194 start_codon:yes stop_codon:yes gene_type:complete
MNLSSGRDYLAIPGPSVSPERVLNAMHTSAPNIYEGKLVDVVAGMIPDLKAVARTKGAVAIYIANGHGAWEAAAMNVLAPGDTALVLATGRFAALWGTICNRMGIETEVIDFGRKAALDPERVEEALRADTNHRIKAVLTVQTDTATGVLNDIAGLRAAMDRAGHPALLMVDCIASLACDRFEMDDWGVDVMVAASQKGLMTPPGLGFVFFNERAKARQNNGVSYYWDWRPRVAPEGFYQYFGGTAPTHHLLGLRAALDLIAEEGGVEAVWHRHDLLARTAWAAFETWGQGGPMEINVADPKRRSRAVTALALGADNGTRLRRWVETNGGLTLGIGLGMSAPDDPKGDGFFRLGHMGHVNAHMILGALGVIEAGLRALDIPHGNGALGAAADVIARG